MKKLILLFSLISGLGFGQVANDLIWHQQKPDNSGSIQRNVSPTANAALGADANKLPVALTAFTQDSATGAVGVTAAGTNQSITLTPSGTGMVTITGTGATLRFHTDTPLVRASQGRLVTSVASAAFASTGLSALNTTTTAYATMRVSNTAGLADANSMDLGIGGTATGDGLQNYGYLYSGSSVNGIRVFTNGNTTARWEVNNDGSLRAPSTNTAGLQLYNTADQTTNYERASVFWSSNRLRLQTQQSGTGVTRGIELGLNSPSVTLLIRSDDRTNGILQFDGPSSSTPSTIGARWMQTNTATSGTNVAFSISNTYNQTSGTAENTDLKITRTETAVGSGAQNFITAGTAALGNLFSVTNRGKIVMDTTITSGGTTGNQTINKPTGTVNIAASGTTVTVTNSLCTTSSIVLAVLRTNDATAAIANVVPGSGSFTINLTAMATAEVSIGFVVIN